MTGRLCKPLIWLRYGYENLFLFMFPFLFVLKFKTGLQMPLCSRRIERATQAVTARQDGGGVVGNDCPAPGLMVQV